MSKLVINDTTLTAIGDAIRNKTGKSDLIAPGAMPAEIDSIQAGGSDNYTLYGAYMLNEYVLNTCKHTELDLKDENVYTYFWDQINNKMVYSKIGKIVIDSSKNEPMNIYDNNNVLTNVYVNDYGWYAEQNLTGMVSYKNKSNSYRIVIFREPFNTTEQQYSAFLGTVNNNAQPNVYQMGWNEGHEVGYTEGKRSGLTPLDVIDTLLCASGSTLVDGGYGEEEQLYIPTNTFLFDGNFEKSIIVPPDVLIENQGTINDVFGLAIIPSCITQITECALDDVYDVPVVILAKNPPLMSWQGMWSVDGGGCPPSAIYVPDESVEAYKAHTDYAEYVDLITPVSEFDYSIMGF